MKPFIIKDWASNVCFDGREFDTFEDAWEFLYEMFPEGDQDGTFDEYFVELKHRRNTRRTEELRTRVENLSDRLWFKLNRTARYTERFNTLDARIDTVHRYWSKCN